MLAVRMSFVRRTDGGCFYCPHECCCTNPLEVGGIPKHKLIERFNMFNRGQWEALLRAGGVCCTQAGVRRRRSRHRGDNVPGRVAQAEALVHLGELSSAQQVLEGAQLAPGFRQTLQKLSDQSKRPREARVPGPPEVVNHRPDSQFNLGNLRSARRGAAGGPSCMTVEHLQVLLDHSKDAKQLYQVAELLSRAEVPVSVRDAVRLGRLTALQKPDGGVRGIVAGDIVRRLVARTMSQQLSAARDHRVGPSNNVSIDGISLYDLISLSAMMQGIHRVHEAAVLFVSMFYGTASTYLWEDDEGTTHKIVQGEGGEQGDAMMPLLFSLCQHPALEAV